MTEEIRAESIQTRGKDMGPTVKLRLHAPGRQASTIRSFKGKMQVIEAESKSLSLQNLAALDGKFIDHPDLKDVKIRPVITKTASGDAIVAMQVTGKTARLSRWFLMKDEKALEAVSGGQSPIENGVEYNKGFNGRFPEGVVLVLLILVPVRSQALDFEMEDIELP